MTRITKRDEAVRQRYESARPKFLGDLHQRMKFVVSLAQEWRNRSDTPGNWRGIDEALWQAIHDLEVEVQYTPPADPPYGKRESRKGVGA